MHRIGQLPIMGLMLAVILIGSASAYTLVVDRAGGNVTVTLAPQNIEETFYGSGSISLVILNNLNESINVTIYSGSITPSDNSFTVSANDVYVVEFPFTKDYDGQFKYTISSSDFQKVVTQSVSVDIRGAEIAFTKSINVTLEEKSLKRVYVTFRNTGDATLDVDIDVSGSSSVISAIPDSFTLVPDGSVVVTYIIYGKNDTAQIPVTYSYDGEKETVIQTFHVKATPMKEILEMTQEMKNKESTLKDYMDRLNRVSLQGDVSLQVPQKGVVRQPITVKVTFNGKPLDKGILLVSLNDYSTVVEISQGIGSFTPTLAGDYMVKLLNGFGDVVAVKTIKVERAKWNFAIPKQEVGKPFTVVLPEVADLKITKDGKVVFSGSGQDRYNVTLTQLGEYKASFVGQSYTGETTFKVTGIPALTLIYGNKVITPGAQVVAGRSMKVTATVGGVPVSGKVRVMYPASAYGYSSQDIQNLMLQQMFMQMYISYYGGRVNSSMQQLGMTFIPPDKIMIEIPAPNGVAVVPLPDKTNGYVTVTFITEDGNIAGQYVFKVTPKTLLGGYEYYVIAALLVIIALTVMIKRGVISVPDRLRSIAGRVRGRVSRKAELPDLE